MAAKTFSDQVRVDISAGGRLLFSIVLCLGLIGYAVWSELTGGLFGIRALLPLVLSTLWSGMWPAMQYWGGKTLYFPACRSISKTLNGGPLGTCSAAAWRYC